MREGDGWMDGRRGRSVSLTWWGHFAIHHLHAGETEKATRPHAATEDGSLISRLLVGDPVSPVIAACLDA